MGSAIQTRVLSILKIERLLRHRVVHYWTPHSGRNFLPTATATVGYQKQEHHPLGVLVCAR